MDFGKAFAAVRRETPLVQCITNFVTVNDCANMILAAGGSPTMAEHPLEAHEAVRKARALVCDTITTEGGGSVYAKDDLPDYPVEDGFGDLFRDEE